MVTKHQNNWLLDLGASHHMCLHRSWFSSYQSIDEGVVYMGNDISYKKIGIESVKIRMYNGVVKTLNEVSYVPELRKNLISMGVLDAIGYKFAVQGGVIKVFKGILVVMKAIRIENMYELEESYEVSQVAVLSKATSDPYCQWHQCLGHM